VLCPNCATENLPGSKFCRECAAPLASGCPNCGFVNLPNSKFCAECATPLAGAVSAPPLTVGAPAQPTATATPESERRLVSVLFADLVGFTPFAEERDSEDVRETLSRYFDMAREVIERYGGTVEKFIGDAVMAVWGAPTAREDDAELAVRAALELVDAVGGLGKGIQARAGVLTGEAAVTLGATNQGMVAGDIVNTASRLQSAAQPGTVLVGESTHRATSAAIAYEEAGEQALKGKQAPVAAWRALRAVAERGGRNRAEQLEAPFVGRAEEMRLLKDLFQTTGREKRLRVVSVIGPAGIGKSRLAREFLIYIDGLLETVYWHSGRCPAYGEGITFWALGEMVRERAGLAEFDDEKTTRTKVAESVAEWVTDPNEREWIGRALLTLLGVEGGMASDQLFSAWRTFFERIAARGPVALVFEDMHFADQGLLDFIDHLLEWSRGVPIYVVTLARPELIEKRPSWGAGKRNFFSMYLEPLPEDEMRELLAGLAPGLPEKAVATIVKRADGIPLYAVETVRTLVADGKLVEQDGVYVPSGDLTDLAVPETLTALIAARLDRLDETDRRIVHDAAVLGQSFTEDALAALSEVPVVDLEERLAGLVRRELLRHELDPRSPERGQYAFVQALIREVAYNTLSKRDRRKLHLAAARYFESMGSDEIAGALASHYLAAHANASEGAEADALAGQARIALKAAAARAKALGSFDQAVAFLEQALTVTTDPTERADLLEQAAAAASTAGRLADAESLLRRSLDLRQELGDRVGEARVVGVLGYVLGSQYRAEEAAELLEPALERLADIDDPAVLGWLKSYVATTRARLNQHESMLPLLEEVLVTAEHLGLMELLVRSLLSKGNALVALDRRREGMSLTATARDIAAEFGLTDMQLRATSNLAGGLAEFDLRRAMQLNLEGIALAERSGQRGNLLGLVSNIGYTGFLAGEWDVALPPMEAALQEEMAPRDRMQILNNAIIIRAALGRDVSEQMAELEKSSADMSGPLWRAFIADPAANRALALGDLARAREQFKLIYGSDTGQTPEYSYRAALVSIWARDLATAQELRAVFEATGGAGAIVDARRASLRAGIAALEGRPAEALPLYRDALRNWRSAGAVWDEVLTGISMAMLLDLADPEVAAAIESTRAILERLGAKPYLERLDAAVARQADEAESAPAGDSAIGALNHSTAAAE
jgi:class 3 adenylate cyclase/tetratricopeptide (TPR) repeat protein